MIIDDEKLSCFKDGELPQEEMALIANALEQEPALAARLEQFRQIDTLLANACSAIDRKPLPARVIELLDGRELVGESSAAEPVAIADAHAESASPPRRAWGSWALPLAASIVLAVMAGYLLRGQRQSDTSVEMLAAGASSPVIEARFLQQALERTPSAHAIRDDSGGFSITPQLTFRSTSNEFCREYLLETEQGSMRGVACRQDGRWRTLRTIEAGIATATVDTYEVASQASDAGFDAFVDQLMHQVPLSAEDESALIRAGWHM